MYEHQDECRSCDWQPPPPVWSRSRFIHQPITLQEAEHPFPRVQEWWIAEHTLFARRIEKSCLKTCSWSCNLLGGSKSWRDNAGVKVFALNAAGWFPALYVVSWAQLGIIPEHRVIESVQVSLNTARYGHQTEKQYQFQLWMVYIFPKMFLK